MLGRMQWELQPSLEEAETYCKEKPGAEAGLQVSDLEGIFGIETDRKKGTSHTPLPKVTAVRGASGPV